MGIEGIIGIFHERHTNSLDTRLYQQLVVVETEATIEILLAHMKPNSRGDR